MSIIVFVDDMPTEDGKYRVVQEDSETKEPFGVKDFDTEEEPSSMLKIYPHAVS
jgi:hypothetical protein